MSSIEKTRRAEAALARQGINSWSPSMVAAMTAFSEDEAKALRSALQEIADEDDTFNYGHKLPGIAQAALKNGD